MKIITKLSEIPEKNIAVTIGNFDGVHLGHQYVLNKIKSDLSSDEKLVVISFNPHPVEVLAPKANFLINEINEKYELLEAQGIDYLFEISFTRDLSTLTGLEFLDRNLKSVSHTISFYLGYDFSFGANKKDGVEIIEGFCKDNGYAYKVLDRQSVKELSISSSKIRDLINNGDTSKANELLGREFYVTGMIVKGEGRGRQIGFPTANMQLSPSRIVPAKGVYHTNVLYKGGKYKSVTNIGVNPTFGSDSELTVETFLLDFDKDIYGESFVLYFDSKLRDEKKFASVNDLIEQITRDVEARRNRD